MKGRDDYDKKISAIIRLKSGEQSSPFLLNNSF